MAAGKELEIPGNKADGVIEAMKDLNRQLRPDHMRSFLQQAGEFLYTATLATAKDAEQQIKAQNCLFNAVKLCDAWNLMLTNFKVGANDILEKFHIAYLKLLDGFPDFALEDVKSISRQVTSMKTACKKAEGSFTKATNELSETMGFLKDQKKELDQLRKTLAAEYRRKATTVEQTLIDKLLKEDPADVARDPTVKVLELEMVRLVDNFHDAGVKMKNCLLAHAAMEQALPKLKEALDFLSRVESTVYKWFNECKEVVEKNMKTNLQQADKLSGQRQKDFYSRLLETAYGYLCRWKALYQICLDNAAQMRRVRGEIDWYYTDNPRPADALKKAWELKGKHESLKTVEAGNRYSAVPDENRNSRLRSFEKLLGMKGPPGDAFSSITYKEQIEGMTFRLSLLKNIFEHRYFQEVELNFRAWDTLQVVTRDYQKESLRQLIHGFLSCNFILDGIPDDGWTRPVDLGNLKNSLARLSGDRNRLMSVKGLTKTEQRLVKALERAIDDEDGGGIGLHISDIRHVGVKKSVHSHEGNGQEKKSRSVAEALKKCKLSVDISRRLEDDLPPVLAQIEKGYAKVLSEMKGVSSGMKEKMEMGGRYHEVTPDPRDMRWQDGVVGLLERFLDIFSASCVQLTMVAGSTIEFPHAVDWSALRALVDFDPYIKAVTNDVDYEVGKEVERLQHKAKESMANLIKDKMRVKGSKQTRGDSEGIEMAAEVGSQPRQKKPKPMKPSPADYAGFQEERGSHGTQSGSTSIVPFGRSLSQDVPKPGVSDPMAARSLRSGRPLSGSHGALNLAFKEGSDNVTGASPHSTSSSRRSGSLDRSPNHGSHGMLHIIGSTSRSSSLDRSAKFGSHGSLYSGTCQEQPTSRRESSDYPDEEYGFSRHNSYGNLGVAGFGSDDKVGIKSDARFRGEGSDTSGTGLPGLGITSKDYDYYGLSGHGREGVSQTSNRNDVGRQNPPRSSDHLSDFSGGGTRGILESKSSGTSNSSRERERGPSRTKDSGAGKKNPQLSIEPSINTSGVGANRAVPERKSSGTSTTKSPGVMALRDVYETRSRDNLQSKLKTLQSSGYGKQSGTGKQSSKTATGSSTVGRSTDARYTKGPGFGSQAPSSSASVVTSKTKTPATPGKKQIGVRGSAITKRTTTPLQDIKAKVDTGLSRRGSNSSRPRSGWKP